ncbi:amidase [Mycolicibacterium sp.]|uniref:amidase n=1 Tax=Mycolicibacterium sp. TaxID=2320850 RepID=UPI0028A654B3|nr:amidase [Mycolicibacterium sp.]
MLHELAGQVRSGQIDPLDLVEESLRRIAADNHNAVIRVEADAAREAAATHPRIGPLAGLPLLVKDLARCEGSVTTMGSPFLRDAAVDLVDDLVVARLRAAGAIVVGRTNSPAYGHAAFTANTLFGATTNPWNPQRSPGGSSGGSAAALAAGLAPLASTSDGGGSVRIPASACGLVGWKPTLGSVGRNVLPTWIEFSTQGATAATVADVVLQASIITGLGSGDWLSVPAGTCDLTPARPARVLACRTFRADVDPAIEAAFEATLATLAADGLAVERVEAPSDNATFMAWLTIATAELAQRLGPERHRWDELEASLVSLLRLGDSVTAADYIAAQRLRHEVGARIDDLIGNDSVLVLPTVNVQSWPAAGPTTDHAGAVTGDPTLATNTADLNATGHPAVSVPMGFDQAGVPVGLQVVAPRFRDGLALGVAQVLERTQPWPLVAPGFTPFGV